MTSPEERIRELVRARGIEGDEAANLLAAVRPDANVKRGKNPFERWSGEVTSIAGGIIAALAVLTSRLGVRYDGALDVHVGSADVPLKLAIVDQLVALPVTALVFWAIARLVSRSPRFVDVLGVIGVSRLPVVLAAPALALLTPHVAHDPAKPGAATAALVIIALAVLGAQITLLVLGFRTVTSARGGKLAAAFVGALVLAEVLTKVVLSLVS